MDKRLSLGINASILLILIIFCALLSLPLKYLFNTNYKGTEPTEINSQTTEQTKQIVQKEEIPPEVKDFKKMNVCPFNYELWMKSLFITNYDKNCTEKPEIKENPQVPLEEKTEEIQTVDLNIKNEKPNEILSTLSTTKKKDVNNTQINKSIPVAVHILAIMLVVSVIVALAEVVRIRFARDKDLSTTGNVTIRRGSVINLMAQKKEMLKSQRSLDLQAMHRSTRLLGMKSVSLQGRRGHVPRGPRA
ncbi:uncharacterized protein LOC122508204 isoform X2 [Leptopilina heterotoma]|uniref:uncharacterized protein LOC122508204 isoform X2 n=1 Tax=Leptopilina heterotoma TaxID=63436 RepID=UPI001CA84A56|nr:uncharacterized protein LOC122508204 isoform X2 [Leptopilina heterotoma]